MAAQAMRLEHAGRGKTLDHTWLQLRALDVPKYPKSHPLLDTRVLDTRVAETVQTTDHVQVEVAREVPSALAILTTIETAIIKPALATETDDAFIEFITTHAGDLRRLTKLLSEQMPPVPPDVLAQSRTAPLLQCFARAYELGRESAETAVRRAIADGDYAQKIIATAVQGSPFSEADRVPSGDYAFGLDVADACLLCLKMSTGEVPRFVAVIGGVIAGAGIMLEAARQAANLRGKSVELELDWLNRAWSRPCESMFAYVAEERPSMLTRCIRSDEYNEGQKARAALALSRVKEPSEIKSIVEEVFDGASNIVQEALIEALTTRMSDGPEIRSTLEILARKGDSSEVVREALADALAEG